MVSDEESDNLTEDPFKFFFTFGCARSSLLQGLFSSCGKQELLSSCGAQAAHCGGLSCCGAQVLECTSFTSCGI